MGLKAFFHTTRKKFRTVTKKYNTQLKYVASIYPGIAAAAMIFLKDEITSRPFWSVLYWGTVIIWIFVYFFFVTNESITNTERNEELKSSIFRSPNPKIFSEYQTYFELITSQLRELKQAKIEDYHDAFKSILEVICQLTNSYLNKKDTEVVYRANIMLYVPTSLERSVVKHLRKEKECFHFKNIKTKYINGVLQLVPGLTYSNKKNAGAFSAIVLPILNLDHDNDDELYNLPGAPRAMLSGLHICSVVYDKALYKRFTKKEKRIAKEYWKDEAQGVKSFISLAIPHVWDINDPDTDVLNKIGVLNIDSTKIDILGTTVEYHTTYTALLYPILCQISPYLRAYYQLFIENLKKKIAK